MFSSFYLNTSLYNLLIFKSYKCVQASYQKKLFQVLFRTYFLSGQKLDDVDEKESCVRRSKGEVVWIFFFFFFHQAKW